MSITNAPLSPTCVYCNALLLHTPDADSVSERCCCAASPCKRRPYWNPRPKMLTCLLTYIWYGLGSRLCWLGMTSKMLTCWEKFICLQPRLVLWLIYLKFVLVDHLGLCPWNMLDLTGRGSLLPHPWAPRLSRNSSKLGCTRVSCLG